VKRPKLALVAAAGLAAMTLLTAAPALAAAKPTTPASAVPTPNGVKFDPSKAKCSTVPGASAGTKRCVEMERLPLSDLTAAQLAQRQQAMAKLSAKAKQAQAAAAPAAAATAPAACGFSSSGVPNGVYTVSPSRLLSCSDFFWTVLDVEVVDGAVTILGNFPFEDQSWVTFSATKLSWVHDMQTISYAGGGSLSDGVDGFMSSNCTAVPTACTVTSPGDPQVIFLASGSTNSWEWNEQDAGPASTTAGTVDNLDAVLGVNWDLVDGSTTFSQTETGGLYGRCDNGVARANTKGCVDEKFIPTLYISYATAGAAADMINYAEWNIPPYYGNEYSPTPTPLHRLTDPILVGTPTSEGNNREIICGGFTLDPTITAALAPYSTTNNTETDSCDEYPFNATYESGAMVDGADGNPKPYVTTGADCAQVTAIHTDTSNNDEAQDWNAATFPPAGSDEPCIRGHVPGLLNSLVGSQYSSLTVTNRLIDKDAFWVWVTA
jgi:hypothetical protein